MRVTITGFDRNLTVAEHRGIYMEPTYMHHMRAIYENSKVLASRQYGSLRSKLKASNAPWATLLSTL